MSYAKLRSELLGARELRQQELDRELNAGRTLVSLSLNVPGTDKLPPGSAVLFAWAKVLLGNHFPDLTGLREWIDLLGPFALYSTDLAPRAAKLRCVDIETAQPAARLLDLDVNAPSGAAVDRTELGLPRRACLLCRDAAVDCIRRNVHDQNLVVRRAHELIAAFAG
jgi:holo-ACP synthase